MTIRLKPSAKLGVIAFFGLLAAWVPQAGAQAQQTTDQDADATQTESVEADSDSPTLSFIDGLLEGAGNKIGFAVGLFHVYSSHETNPLLLPSTNRPSIFQFTAAQPRVFTKFEGRRSRLRLDYGFGYKVYQRDADLDGAEHSVAARFDRTGRRSHLNMEYAFGGTSFNNRPSLDSEGHSASVNYSQTLSPRASLHLSDTARRYTYSDVFRTTFETSALSIYQFIGSLNAGNSLAFALQEYFSNFGRDVYFINNEQVTSNVASASLDYTATSKTTLRFSGGHEFQSYKTQDLNDIQSVRVGIHGDYRINEWLYFDAAYDTYLNSSYDQLQGSNIHRLQIGGFRHRTRGGLELSGSGGLDYSRYNGANHTGASFYGSAAKTAGPANFILSYRHGLTSANGLGLLLTSDDATASVSAELSSRVSLAASASYQRGSTGGDQTSLKTFSGSGGLQVALMRHLMFTTQYSLISQRTRNVPLSVGDLDRYAVSAGFQYFLPQLYRR